MFNTLLISFGTPLPIDLHEIQDLYQNCTFCDINPTVPSSSTERDLVILFTTSRPGRLSILVRSLRSVGCRAKIIALVPLNTKVPSEISDCGVDFIEVSSPSERILRSPHKARWEWIYEYLAKNIDNYDRILHSDSFDAFAQGDPFYKIDENKLYAIGEGLTIQESEFNKRWLKECYPTDFDNLKNEEVLCSGTLIGGSKLFFEVVKTMVTRPEWDSCWSKAKDQPEFIHVIYTDLIKRIPIVTLSCKSGFLTMGECSEMQIKFVNLWGQITLPHSFRTPRYIHQYNRYNNVDRHIQKLCGANISRKEEKRNSEKEKVSHLGR